MSPKRILRLTHTDEVIVMAVHQCPRCPLRFSFRTELEFHLREDHEQRPHAAGAREASEPIAPPALALRRGGVPGLIDRRQWPHYEAASDRGVEEISRDYDSSGRTSPRTTLMPRGVVMSFIVIVIFVLGLGVLLGS